jgi:predicted transcriptional regulator
MQSANLNYIQTRKYLGYMVQSGFLMVTRQDMYVITEKGHKYLQMVEMQGLRSIR